MENALVVVSSSRFFRNLSDATVKSLCSKYGSENVVEKIQNLEEQYTGRDMNNPGGLLRDALKKDYKPTKRIDRKKRDEKNAIEQAKQEKVEKEMHRQEEALRQNLSARKSGMSKKQRAKLRKQALEEIRATEGIREDFITEVLVEAKENEILKREVDE